MSPIAIFLASPPPLISARPHRRQTLIHRPFFTAVRCRRGGRKPNAYVSAPAFEPDAVSKKIGSDADAVPLDAAKPRPVPVSWDVVLPLVFRHKIRLVVAVASLVGCSCCTLAMPLMSGKFFEILIGKRSEPLWSLLSKIAVLYTLEPIFTIIFVTNMTLIWEKVMTSLRGQIFRRILIQKVEFFDRHKVGELTGLLTNDLGSLKDVVSENISRDRGLRALSEARYLTLLTM